MSRRKMFISMVLSSIMRRRSRVIIAILAVAIGATTLSALATIAIDVPRQMAREMRSYGSNVVVLPSEADAFDPAILEKITTEIPADKLVGTSGLDYEPITINDLPFVAAGTDLKQTKTINPYWYIDGQWPDSPGQVLIGKEIAETTEVKPGDTITLTQFPDEKADPQPKDDAPADTTDADAPTSEQADEADADAHKHLGDTGELTDAEGKPIAPSGSRVEEAAPGAGAELRTLNVVIAGVLETGGSEDGFVYLASTDLEELTGRSHRLTVAELSIAANGSELDAIATQIDRAHKEVNASPVARLTHSDENILDMLKSLMAIITIIVLALIVIGVSTTMMAVVTERRNEIGLRKALGAGNRSIMWEFLGEAIVLGLIGGVIGAAAGYGLAQVISWNVFHRLVNVQPLVIVTTILLSVIISTLASLIPVRRAIEIDPALVLRGE